jgi:signal transduction protein with GAF and PtsI domain
MSRRPRLLPLYIRNILKGVSAKKSAQILYPALTELKVLSFAGDLLKQNRTSYTLYSALNKINQKQRKVHR